MLFLERFLSGAEFREPLRMDPLPLDFAVTTPTATYCLQADWWTLADWGIGKGILVVSAELQEDGTFEGLTPGTMISSPTDEFFQRLCDEARYRTDANRYLYLQALRRLQELEPGFNFAPWIKAIEERPAIDARAALEERMTALRALGRIMVLDADGRPSDSLVIDSLGNSEVSNPDGWLALFADEWSGYHDETRPEIGAYLSFVTTKQPPGPGALSDPEVFEDGGDLASHVARGMATAPAAT